MTNQQRSALLMELENIREEGREEARRRAAEQLRQMAVEALKRRRPGWAKGAAGALLEAARRLEVQDGG